MSGGRAVPIFRNAAFAGMALLGAQSAAANDNVGTLMTAETVMREMPVRDRTNYIMGIVEGFAYERLQHDTREAGEPDENGMNCIYRWFYEDGMSRLDQIEAAFTNYGDHYPAVILSVMIRRECGE
jgi:hypothetical protein